MRSVNKGPSIQVKEEKKIPFFSEKCCELGYYSDHVDAEFPDRCSEHNKQFMKWKRIKATKKKFKKLFQYKRHRFIKMITFGLPGDKITTNQVIGKKKIKTGTNFERKMVEGHSYTKHSVYKNIDVYQVNQDHANWRDLLRSKFAKLRRDKFWNDHVDGGIWFYETKLTELDSKNQQSFEGSTHEMNDIRIKIHPHFHCIVLGPKNLAGPERDFRELNNLFEKHGLGKPSVTTSKDKNGRKRNASLNKSLWYLTNYLKKQEHAEGKNRGSFGIFHKK